MLLFHMDVLSIKNHLGDINAILIEWHTSPEKCDISLTFILLPRPLTYNTLLVIVIVWQDALHTALCIYI